MDLFNVVAKLTLDSTEYEAQVNAVSQRVIPIDTPGLKLDTTDYDKEINEAGDEAEDFEDRAGGAFSRVGELLKTAGIVAAVGAIANGFKKAIEYTANLGDEIDKGSKRMNISTHAYQQFDHALQQSGGSVNDLQRGLKNIRQIMTDGEEATGKAAEAFNTLGIDMQKSNGQMKTAEELMNETLMALAEIEDADQRGALVDALFGPNSGGIKPLLEEGKEGVKDLLNEADELNMIMSDEDIQKAVEYGDAVANMKKELELLQVDFAKNILPVLTDCVKAITDIINFFRGNGLGGAAGVATVLGGTAVGKSIFNWGVNKLLGTGGSGGGTGGSSGGGGFVKGLVGKGLTALKSGLAANGLWALTPAAVLAAGLAPGLIAQNEATENMRAEQAQMEQNAANLEAANSENAVFVRTTAGNSYLVKDENGNERKNFLGQSYSQLTDATFESLMGLKDRSGAEMAKLEFALRGVSNPMTGNYAWTDLQKLWRGELEANDAPELAKAIADALSGTSIGKMWEWQRGSGFVANGETPEVEVQPTVDSEAQAELQRQLDEGTYTVDVMPSMIGMFRGNEHAAGAWDIPWDNYPALLHRDEMVLTASQARRYREGGGGGLDYDTVGTMIGVAIENAMGRVMVMMSGEKVGDLTTRQVKNNINADSFSRIRALGG